MRLCDLAILLLRWLARLLAAAGRLLLRRAVGLDAAATAWLERVATAAAASAAATARTPAAAGPARPRRGWQRDVVRRRRAGPPLHWVARVAAAAPELLSDAAPPSGAAPEPGRGLLAALLFGASRRRATTGAAPEARARARIEPGTRSSRLGPARLRRASPGTPPPAVPPAAPPPSRAMQTSPRAAAVMAREPDRGRGTVRRGADTPAGTARSTASVGPGSALPQLAGDAAETFLEHAAARPPAARASVARTPEGPPRRRGSPGPCEDVVPGRSVPRVTAPAATAPWPDLPHGVHAPSRPAPDAPSWPELPPTPAVPAANELGHWERERAWRRFLDHEQRGRPWNVWPS